MIKMILSFLLLTLVSCIPQGSNDVTFSSGDSGPSTSGGVGGPSTTTGGSSGQVTVDFSTRNYEQLNKIYSSLTGVHPSFRSIRYENDRIGTSLSIGHDSTSFSGFNQIATTALAMAYCREWVQSHRNIPTHNDVLTIFGVLKGFGSTFNNDYKNQIISHFYEKLAHTSESNDPFLQLARPEIAAIMDVTSDESIVKVTQVNSNSRGIAYIEEVILGCGFFLSSAYFIFDGN